MRLLCPHGFSAELSAELIERTGLEIVHAFQLHVDVGHCIQAVFPGVSWWT